MKKPTYNKVLEIDGRLMVVRLKSRTEPDAAKYAQGELTSNAASAPSASASSSETGRQFFTARLVSAKFSRSSVGVHWWLALRQRPA